KNNLRIPSFGLAILTKAPNDRNSTQRFETFLCLLRRSRLYRAISRVIPPGLVTFRARTIWCDRSARRCWWNWALGAVILFLLFASRSVTMLYPHAAMRWIIGKETVTQGRRTTLSLRVSRPIALRPILNSPI